MFKEFSTIIHENPFSSPWIDKPIELDRSDLLPAWAAHDGMELYYVSSGIKDPVVIYDRWGKILYQWPEDYYPHWAEIYEVCETLRK